VSQHETEDNNAEEEVQTETKPERGLSTNRIEALSDGVFAIAMTLLVLNIHLPENLTQATSTGEVLQKLFFDQGQGAVLVAYVMSFALLGVYWVSHHVQFQYIRRTDRNLLWINILFLMLISFVPFTTQVVGVYWNGSNGIVGRTVLIMYGIHLILIDGVIYLHWWYGTVHYRLTEKKLERHIIRSGARRILVAPIFCIAGCVLAFVNPIASIICYLLIPLFYILPGDIDRHWGLSRHRQGKHEEGKHS